MVDFLIHDNQTGKIIGTGTCFGATKWHHQEAGDGNTVIGMRVNKNTHKIIDGTAVGLTPIMPRLESGNLIILPNDVVVDSNETYDDVIKNPSFSDTEMSYDFSSVAESKNFRYIIGGFPYLQYDLKVTTVFENDVLTTTFTIQKII